MHNKGSNNIQVGSRSHRLKIDIALSDNFKSTLVVSMSRIDLWLVPKRLGQRNGEWIGGIFGVPKGRHGHGISHCVSVWQQKFYQDSRQQFCNSRAVQHLFEVDGLELHSTFCKLRAES